jgi:hypothetical protein
LRSGVLIVRRCLSKDRSQRQFDYFGYYSNYSNCQNLRLIDLSYYEHNRCSSVGDEITPVMVSFGGSDAGR